MGNRAGSRILWMSLLVAGGLANPSLGQTTGDFEVDYVSLDPTGRQLTVVLKTATPDAFPFLVQHPTNQSVIEIQIIPDTEGGEVFGAQTLVLQPTLDPSSTGAPSHRIQYGSGRTKAVLFYRIAAIENLVNKLKAAKSAPGNQIEVKLSLLGQVSKNDPTLMVIYPTKGGVREGDIIIVDPCPPEEVDTTNPVEPGVGTGPERGER